MARLADDIWLHAASSEEAVLLLRAYYRVGKLGPRTPLLALTPQVVEAAISTGGRNNKAQVVLATVQRLFNGSSFNPWNHMTLLEQGELVLPMSQILNKVYRVLCMGVATVIAGKWSSIIPNPDSMSQAIHRIYPVFQVPTLLQWMMDLTRRTLPSYDDLPETEAIRMTWSTVRLQHNALVLWTQLCCDAIDDDNLREMGKRRTTPIDLIALDLLSDTPGGTWNQHDTPPIGEITMLQVWTASVNRDHAIALLRAYYRTGQLHPKDQPTMATCNYYYDVERARHMNNFGYATATLRDYIWEIEERIFQKTNITPATSLLVKAAIPYLNHEEMAVYRANQFYGFMHAFVSYGRHISVGIFGDFFESNETGVEYEPLAHGEDMTAVEWWRQLYTELDRINVEAYVSAHRTFIHTPPAKTIEKVKEALSEVNLHAGDEEDEKGPVPPQVTAYTHLLQSLLDNPADPIGQALETSPPYPQVYGSAVPLSLVDGKWNTDLLPPLNQLIAGYAFIPTYDEVLARIAAL